MTSTPEPKPGESDVSEDRAEALPENATDPQRDGGPLAKRYSLNSLYLSADAPQPKAVAKALSRNEGWAFPQSEVEHALGMVPVRDPDLKRTRSIVHELADDQRLRESAVHFGALATRADVPRAISTWPLNARKRESADPAELLRAIGEHLGPVLRTHPSPKDKEARLQARRAHNALMICVDYLNVAAGLAAEDAIPILRGTLGEPSELGKGRPNPRRVRIRALTDANLGRERIRGLLELLQPWIETLSESRAQADAAESRARKATRAQETAEGERTRLAERISQLEQELATSRQDLARLNDRVRDAGVLAQGDLEGLRGRTASVLESRIAAKLETAMEALETEPEPRLSVTRRMLEEAQEELGEHLKWLKSSD